MTNLHALFFIKGKYQKNEGLAAMTQDLDEGMGIILNKIKAINKDVKNAKPVLKVIYLNTFRKLKISTRLENRLKSI